MPPSRTRSLRTPSPPRRGAARAPVEPDRLKLLVAGVGKDERGPIEAAVRRAFADRDPGEPWSVSLVRLGGKWSVTLSGPTERFRHVSFTAEPHRLAKAIAEAIGARGQAEPAPVAEPATSSTHGLVQERHECGHCGGGILVSYEGQPDEPKEVAPLACPHCWVVSPVRIGAWAVAGRDYRAEKA